MKGKDSNCVGILSDQGEAATASSLIEYTILDTGTSSTSRENTVRKLELATPQ